MTSLELAGVSRAFGGLRAVHGLTMSIPAGQVTGLIGPNGAGKTTTVNLITGLLRLSAGRVSLGDADLSRLEPHAVARSGISRTFQTVRLLREASVVDNVLAGCHVFDRVSPLAKLFGLPAVRRQERAFRARVDRLLTRFGMSDLADRRAGELAYGYQRRVEIMRALVMEPRVLLLDEPAAGMNDIEAHELGRMFRELAADGLAVLLIEHNMRLVMEVCDRIYVLASGEKLAEGTPETVRREACVIEAYLGV